MVVAGEGKEKVAVCNTSTGEREAKTGAELAGVIKKDIIPVSVAGFNWE